MGFPVLKIRSCGRSVGAKLYHLGAGVMHPLWPCLHRAHADLGIVVDTDVDRSAVVAGNGQPINSNRYIALMAYITLRYFFRLPNLPPSSSTSVINRSR